MVFNWIKTIVAQQVQLIKQLMTLTLSLPLVLIQNRNKTTKDLVYDRPPVKVLFKLEE